MVEYLYSLLEKWCYALRMIHVSNSVRNWYDCSGSCSQSYQDVRRVEGERCASVEVETSVSGLNAVLKIEEY